MQFPLGHSAVVSVIPGATQTQHVVANLNNLKTNIPDSLWADLKNEKLLAANAPLPDIDWSSE